MNDTPTHPIMSTPFFTGLNRTPEWAVNSPIVSKRAPRAGGRTAIGFGSWLKARRLALKSRHSLDQIERRLREAGGHVVTSSTLHRYETEGRVPDVLTIKALADLYSFDFSAAMLMLAKELENPTSVLDQNAEASVLSSSTQSQGGAHGAEAVALRAEILHLRNDIAGTAELLTEITERLTTLASGEVAHGRVQRTGTHKPKRR